MGSVQDSTLEIKYGSSSKAHKEKIGTPNVKDE